MSDAESRRGIRDLLSGAYVPSDAERSAILEALSDRAWLPFGRWPFQGPLEESVDRRAGPRPGTLTETTTRSLIVDGRRPTLVVVSAEVTRFDTGVVARYERGELTIRHACPSAPCLECTPLRPGRAYG